MWRRVVSHVIVQIAVCFLLVKEPVEAELTAASGNVAAVVGSSITFRCNTDGGSQVAWHHITDSPEPNILFNGNRFATRCDFNRCSVATVIPQGYSALTISDVTMSDGGTYKCTDPMGSQQFQLIVLESEPVCSIDSSSSKPMKDGQQLTVTCKLNYSGNCSTVIDCVPHATGEQVSFRDDNGSVSYIKQFNIPRDFGDKTIACTTRFTTNCTNAMKDGFPSFTHSWKSDPLNIDEIPNEPSAGSAGRLVVGIVIGCLTAAVIFLIVALAVVVYRRTVGSAIVSGSDQCNENHDDNTAPKSIRNSRLGKRISHLYSRIRKREQNNAGQQHNNNGFRETINEYGQVYDAVGDKPIPSYDASFSKYVNAPDEENDCHSTIMELGDETESTNYAEVPE